MLKNNIIEIYKLLGDGDYRRLNNSVDIDIFIGIRDCKYCFVVRDITKRVNFKSTELVTIMLEIVPIKEKQLVFILNENKYFDLFVQLINDINEQLIISKRNHIDVAYERWLLWKKMFFSKNNYLSDIQVQGLIGELYFMLYYMIPKYGAEKSVFSWGGADYNKKDFEIGIYWYEIKTVLYNNESIKISSLEQLQGDNGMIILVDMQKTTLENIKRINLLDLVDMILEKINNDVINELFIGKLTNLGFSYDRKYLEYCYFVTALTGYKVDNDFPRLTKGNVNTAITECVYEINRLFLDKYKTKIR